MVLGNSPLKSLSLIARRWIVVMRDKPTSVCGSDRSLLLMLRNSRSRALQVGHVVLQVVVGEAAVVQAEAG